MILTTAFFSFHFILLGSFQPRRYVHRLPDREVRQEMAILHDVARHAPELLRIPQLTVHQHRAFWS